MVERVQNRVGTSFSVDREKQGLLPRTRMHMSMQAGNTMHVHVIGIRIIYALACVEHTAFLQESKRANATMPRRLRRKTSTASGSENNAT